MKCLKCDGDFKRWIEVDGKMKNMSGRKYCLECSPYKQHNTRQVERQQKHFATASDLPKLKTCNRCDLTLDIDKFGLHDRRGKLYLMPFCKKCDSKRAVDRQRELKEKAVVYKGGKCQVCGYNKCLRCLDFHHRDANQKDFEISKYKGSDISDVLMELDKCDLVCKNCHGEIHEKDELTR